MAMVSNKSVTIDYCDISQTTFGRRNVDGGDREVYAAALPFHTAVYKKVVKPRPKWP